MRIIFTVKKFQRKFQIECVKFSKKFRGDGFGSSNARGFSDKLPNLKIEGIAGDETKKFKTGERF